MRYLNCLSFLVCFVLAQNASADLVQLTIYDDGLSCPASCDAHVVFHHTLNATEYAHDPSIPKAPYTKCELGAVCRLCMESGEKQCLEAVYRGGGPPPMTFDFTPAFYLRACETTPTQTVLATKCAELKKAAQVLDGRINCIASPDVAECKLLIETARAAQIADRTQYDACHKEGEAVFNANRPKSEQRTHQCAYEMYGTGGPNSKGKTWKRLLPGACRASTFVGRDGLDCCSGNTLADGPLGRECIGFYPQP